MIYRHVPKFDRKYWVSWLPILRNFVKGQLKPVKIQNLEFIHDISIVLIPDPKGGILIGWDQHTFEKQEKLGGPLAPPRHASILSVMPNKNQCPVVARTNKDKTKTQGTKNYYQQLWHGADKTQKWSFSIIILQVLRFIWVQIMEARKKLKINSLPIGINSMSRIVWFCLKMTRFWALSPFVSKINS